MSTTFCEKCKLEHPGQPCDFKDGECRETPNADTHSYSDLGGFEPYCPRTKTGYDLRLAGRERSRRKEIMKTTMLPGCCGLKTIHQIGCLGRVDAFSTREAEAFDEMVKVGTAQDGMWASYGKAPDTIAIITDSPRYNKPAEFEKQKKFFEAKGWKLLVMWKSHESGGKNYMYGSPEMTPYQEVKAEPVKIEPEVKSTVQPHITI